MRLICHPQTPPRSAIAVRAEWKCVSNGALSLRYEIEPADSVALSTDHLHGRHDNLWRHTCFEFFAKRHGDATYREFNFAPFDAWAGYQFSDWRIGQARLPEDLMPHLVDCRIDDRAGRYPDRYELSVIVPVAALMDSDMKASLTAVIEEVDGTKSYWALAHPPGPPNFHHPACFVLELPAPR